MKPNFTFTCKVLLFEDNLWFYHLLVPKNVVDELLKLESGRRVICTINSEETFHCALMPDGLGDFFINLNQKIRTKLHLSENQNIEVVLSPDNSTFGMPMPEEFEEVLRQDAQALEMFKSLTPGKQRNLIYIVSQVKSSSIKLRRAFVVTEHLKKHGLIDFKALNQEMKESNRQAKR